MEHVEGINVGVTAYRKHGCRCGGCKDAQRAAVAAYRASKRPGPPANAGPRQKPAQHGSRSMYKKCTDGPGGKKCEACKKANRDYQRGYMVLHRAGISMADITR